jgi:hypothetical protein
MNSGKSTWAEEAVVSDCGESAIAATFSYAPSPLQGEGVHLDEVPALLMLLRLLVLDLFPT